MRIVEDVRLCEETFPHVVLTVGSFDGIHLGHRRILEELTRGARAAGGTAALMSLRPHPRQFFSPTKAPNLLTCDTKKEALLAEAGVDVLLVLPFTEEVAALSAQTFLEQIVVGRCRAKQLIVGHDFRFGSAAEGDYDYLKQQASRHGFTVTQVPALFVQGERVSSTLIRERILQGELEDIELFLGRKYSMMGAVVPGRGLGALLGFPTANIEPGCGVVPAHGVYAAEVNLEGAAYRAAVNIGVAPTIRHEDLLIEAHILNFARDVRGAEIEIVFHRRLRPEKKFGSRAELTAAIARDVEDIRAYFATRN